MLMCNKTSITSYLQDGNGDHNHHGNHGQVETFKKNANDSTKWTTSGGVDKPEPGLVVADVISSVPNEFISRLTITQTPMVMPHIITVKRKTIAVSQLDLSIAVRISDASPNSFLTSALITT